MNVAGIPYAVLNGFKSAVQKFCGNATTVASLIMLSEVGRMLSTSAILDWTLKLVSMTLCLGVILFVTSKAQE